MRPGQRPGETPGQAFWCYKRKGLADAPNGAYVPGNPDDVFTVRTDKGSDINVAFTALQRIEQRLAASFMLAEMRDAERVTAERSESQRCKPRPH